MPRQAVLYYGSEEPPPKRVKLRAGPLSMVFEPRHAFLRYIRLGEREVIRGIYPAVRDRNWSTVVPVVSPPRLRVEGNNFSVTFDMEVRQHDIDSLWKGVITGTVEGRVTFAIEGVARTAFLASRIGLCVLHPIRECVGAPCVVETPDGTRERGVFPRYISPRQPFTNIRMIRHEVIPGLSAEVRFTGEVLEMEDQRNWTDASYKTYCPPLSRPYPAEIAEGTTFSQSVTISLAGKTPARAPSVSTKAARLVVATGDGSPVRLPRVGLGAASHRQPSSIEERERLERLELSHLRVDVELSSGDWLTDLTRAAREASALRCSLEVALFLSDSAEEFEHFVEKTGDLTLPIVRWLVFERDGKWARAEHVGLVRRFLRAGGMRQALGSGTNVYFAQFNRGWPPAGRLDFACWSVNPQVHAFDDASLVETLEGQRSTVESARRLAGDLPLVVSPVTLKPRFNPHATHVGPEPVPGEPPPQVDVRQTSLLGAAWTLGSLKHLAESAVHSVTYYETTGRRGVMETGRGSGAPKGYPPREGAVFPLYHVFADVGEFAGGEVVPCTSSDPLTSCGLVLRKDARTRILLANLTPDERSIIIRHPMRRARLRLLDETTAEMAMTSPELFRGQDERPVEAGEDGLALELLPYALARLDIVEEG